MVSRLTAADRDALELVARYRLTTPGILADASDLDLAEAQTLLDRLTESELLVAGDLAPGVGPCYQLTHRATQKLDLDPAFAKPLHRDARIEWYAIASFCTAGGQPRRLYTKEEFVERHGSLWYPGQPVRYYLEPGADGCTRLAYLKVDIGGRGRWDRLIDSCARFLRQRIDLQQASPRHRNQIGAFAELVRRGRFQITVLVALDDKRRSIERELARRAAAGETAPPLVPHVVPGMFSLLHAPSEAESAQNAYSLPATA